MNTLLAFGAGLVLIGGLIWFVVRMAKRLGRHEARLDAAEKGLDHAKEALEIDGRVSRLTDDERARWLRGEHR